MGANGRNGGCLCGAVRFQADGPPNWVAHCHCSSCRRATGAPMTTFAGFARERVTFVRGAPKTFNSSPGVTRGFCGACGTPLSFQGERWPGELHLFVATFDDPAQLTPQAHVNIAQRVPWLEIHDDLPRYSNIPGSS
jgi:hypothetical protein